MLKNVHFYLNIYVLDFYIYFNGFKGILHFLWYTKNHVGTYFIISMHTVQEINYFRLLKLII